MVENSNFASVSHRISSFSSLLSSDETDRSSFVSDIVLRCQRGRRGDPIWVEWSTRVLRPKTCMHYQAVQISSVLIQLSFDPHISVRTEESTRLAMEEKEKAATGRATGQVSRATAMSCPLFLTEKPLREGWPITYFHRQWRQCRVLGSLINIDSRFSRLRPWFFGISEHAFPLVSGRLETRSLSRLSPHLDP